MSLLGFGKPIFTYLCRSEACRSFVRYCHSNAKAKYTVRDLLAISPDNRCCVNVQGWLRGVREHKGTAFLDVSDGSCGGHLQVVAAPQLITEDMTYGASVEVKGVLQASAAKGQEVELVAEEVRLVGACDSQEFPFKLNTRHPLDYQRQYLHLRPKTKTFSSLLRVRSSASKAVHDFFHENGFCQIDTPIITSNDCEGAGEVFQVEPASQAIQASSDKEDLKNFFNHPAYLTVSGQLHLEVVAGAMKKIYTFGPTFRAENSRSRHHLSEFYMIEAEMAFVKTLECLLKLTEDLLKSVTHELLTHHQEDIYFFHRNVAPKGSDQMAKVTKLLEKNFVRMPYHDAISLLEKNKKNFQFDVKWGIDLQKEHERYLVKACEDTPVFVTDFPSEIKPFYMRENIDSNTVSSVDLLCADIGELCGGSLREERLHILEARLQHLQLDALYQWYIDLRKFGGTPTGGFGVGFERYLQFLLGISNIKDTIPFPRSTHNCKL